MDMTKKLYAITVYEGLTRHFHSGGTVLIEAYNENNAREIAGKEFGLDADMVMDPDEVDAQLAKHGLIFEDSGCC